VIAVTELNFLYDVRDSAHGKDPHAPCDADDGLNGAATDAAEHVRTRVDAVTTDTVLRIDAQPQNQECCYDA